MKWNDITYRQFKKLQELGAEASNLAILGVLFPKAELKDIPDDALDFVNEEFPKWKFTKSQEIVVLLNGRQYSFSQDFSKYTIEQWSDYTYLAQHDASEVEILATLLVCEGKYGERPIDEVVEDIYNAPAPLVIGLLGFTTRVFEKSLRDTLWYSALQIMTDKTIPWKKRLKLLWATSKFLARR